MLRPDGSIKPHLKWHHNRLWLDERILVPAVFHRPIVQAYHDQGHWGVSKTVDLVNRRHVTPGVWKLATAVTHECPTCQRTKLTRQPSTFKSLPLPVQRWHSIHLDWIEGLTPAGHERYDSLLVVVDAATRFTHLIPTHRRSTSAQLAWLLL